MTKHVPTEELLTIFNVASDIFAPPNDFEELSVIRLLRQWEHRHSLDDQKKALHSVSNKQWKSLSTPYSFWAVEKKHAHPTILSATTDDLWPSSHVLHPGVPTKIVLTRLQELLSRNDASKLRALVRDVADHEPLLEQLVSDPLLHPPFTDLVRGMMSSHSAAIRALVLEWPLSFIKECSPSLAIVHAIKEASDPFASSNNSSFQKAIDLIASHPPEVTTHSSLCVQELQHHFRHHGWASFDQMRQHLLNNKWDQQHVDDFAPLPDHLLPILVSGRMPRQANEPFFAYWRAHHPNRLLRAIRDIAGNVPLSQSEMDGHCWMWSNIRPLWCQRRINRNLPSSWGLDSVMSAVMHLCEHPHVLAKHIDQMWETLAPVLPPKILGSIHAVEQLANPTAPQRLSLPVLCPTPEVLTKTPLQWSLMSSKPSLNQQAYDVCQQLAAHCTRLDLEHNAKIQTAAPEKPKRKM